MREGILWRYWGEFSFSSGNLLQENTWMFSFPCEISVSTMSVYFSLSLDCCQLHHPVLPMCSWCPTVYSASPIKLKYMGHSHLSLSSYRWADWFLNEVFKNHKKILRKIYWNRYLICIFSFVFVLLNASCIHSLVLLWTSQGTVIGSEANQRAASEVHLNSGTMSLDIFNWEKTQKKIQNQEQPSSITQCFHTL